MFSFILLSIIYLSFISLGLQDSLLGAAWPSMYILLNVPLHYAGIISMIAASGTVASSILSERIIRQFGIGIVVPVSVLMTASSLIGFSFSNNFYYLCLYAVPMGIGAGSLDVALNNYITLHYKARYMNWLHCFWGIGASIGPIIMSTFLIHKNSWSLGYRTIGIFQFFLIGILIFSCSLWKNKKIKDVSSKRNVTKVSQVFRIAGVKYVLLGLFCYCTIEVLTGLWGVSYLVIIKNIPPEIAAKWIALYYFGITAGRFLSGFISMILNNKQMIRLGQAIIGCGIIILILPFENTLLLPGFFLLGLGCAPIFPSILHETPKNFGAEYSQAIIGIQMASAYIGVTIMPPVFGRLASISGFHIFPWFIGVLLIVKIIMIEMLNKKVENRTD